MENISLGKIVHYVIETDHGHYVLPAYLYAQFNPIEYGLRVFTDTGDSEWLVSGYYSERKEPGSFHFREEQ